MAYGNRLVAAASPLGTVHYQYDPAGRRVQKTVTGGADTRFLHAGDMDFEVPAIGSRATKRLSMR